MVCWVRISGFMNSTASYTCSDQTAKDVTSFLQFWAVWRTRIREICWTVSTSTQSPTGQRNNTPDTSTPYINTSRQQQHVNIHRQQHINTSTHQHSSPHLHISTRTHQRAVSTHQHVTKGRRSVFAQISWLGGSGSKNGNSCWRCWRCWCVDVLLIELLVYGTDVLLVCCWCTVGVLVCCWCVLGTWCVVGVMLVCCWCCLCCSVVGVLVYCKLVCWCDVYDCVGVLLVCYWCGVGVLLVLLVCC
jgi:hypothetical protein